MQCRTGDTQNREAELVGQFVKPYTATEMNIEIMVLFAKELDFTLRDAQFRAPFCPQLRAPFCPMRSRNPSRGDDPSLLMDGKAPPPSKRSRRAVERAKVAEGLEGGE